MNLTNYERETIIVFNEAEDTADVYTCNGRLKRRLKELHSARPEDVQHKCSDEVSDRYLVPKKWIKIIPPRILTDETKAKYTESLKMAKNARQSQ